MEKHAIAQGGHYLGMLLVVAFNVAGNLMLKLGATGDKVVLGLFSWQTVVGFAMFGSGVLIYAWVLRYVALHEAQILASLQYVGVILAATALLGERIMPMKWFGIAMIAIGIVICMHEASAS